MKRDVAAPNHAWRLPLPASTPLEFSARYAGSPRKTRASLEAEIALDQRAGSIVPPT